MIEIGITGNIGSGKSAVSAYLKEKGHTIIDADEIVKLIYKDPGFKSDMLSCFGEGIKAQDYASSQELDKRKIFAIVFGDKSKLAALDKIVGPYFKKILDSELKKHQDKEILFLDIPLLFEKNHQKYMDKIILVYCEDTIRYERASKRDGKTLEQIRSVDQTQMPQKEKIKRADYVIDNSGSYENLHRQIEEILTKIEELKHE